LFKNVYGISRLFFYINNNLNEFLFNFFFFLSLLNKKTWKSQGISFGSVAENPANTLIPGTQGNQSKSEHITLYPVSKL
jgi:hypothetical protein